MWTGNQMHIYNAGIVYRTRAHWCTLHSAREEPASPTQAWTKYLFPGKLGKFLSNIADFPKYYFIFSLKIIKFPSKSQHYLGRRFPSSRLFFVFVFVFVFFFHQCHYLFSPLCNEREICS